MKRITGAVIREVVPLFLMGNFFFVFVLLIYQVMDLSELLFVHSVSFFTLARIFIYYMPSFLLITIPVSTLLAVLLAFNRFSSDSELVAMRACGATPGNFIRPVFFVGVTASLLGLAMSMVLMPRGNALAVDSINAILENITVNDLHEKEMYQSLGDVVFYVDEKLDNERFRRIIMINGKDNTIISAAEGTIKSGEAGLLSIDFQNGRALSVDGGQYSSLSFDNMNYNLNLSGSIELINLTGQFMSPEDLKKRFHESPAYIYEYAKRWSMPFSALVMAIAGLVLGSSITRGGRPFGIVLSLVVAFMLNILFFAGESFAAYLSPYFLAWLPNILFALPALVALKRMN